MIFSALRTWRSKRPSPLLHTITVVESDRAPFALGELLAGVLGRRYFDRRGQGAEASLAPREPSKVVSLSPGFVTPSLGKERRALGRVLRVDDLIDDWLKTGASPDFLSPQTKAALIQSALRFVREGGGGA